MAQRVRTRSFFDGPISQLCTSRLVFDVCSPKGIAKMPHPEVLPQFLSSDSDSGQTLGLVLVPDRFCSPTPHSTLGRGETIRITAKIAGRGGCERQISLCHTVTALFQELQKLASKDVMVYHSVVCRSTTSDCNQRRSLGHLVAGVFLLPAIDEIKGPLH